MVYAGTLQQEALALVARKLRSALMVEGELGGEGLSALDADGEDVLAALARRLTQQESGEEEPLEALFEEARGAEAGAGEYVGEWHPEERIPTGRTIESRPEPMVGVAARDTVEEWARCLAGEGGGQESTTEQSAGVGGKGRVVTFAELAGMVGEPRTRRSRPKSPGQLSLLELADGDA